jgi:large subunit ribosomal protein L15
MELHNLPRLKGTKKSKRLGRGNASGWGTYCGRGNKGLGQRKSGNVRPGFEGGQTPLLKRIPKLKGFKNFNKEKYQIINLCDLEKLDNEKVNLESLIKNKIISNGNYPVKVLSRGEVTQKFIFESSLKFSKIAREKVLKAGCKIL